MREFSVLSELFLWKQASPTHTQAKPLVWLSEMRINNRWKEEFCLNAYKSKLCNSHIKCFRSQFRSSLAFCIHSVKKNTIYRDGSSVNVLSKPCNHVYIQDVQMCVWLKQSLVETQGEIWCRSFRWSTKPDPHSPKPLSASRAWRHNVSV